VASPGIPYERTALPYPVCMLDGNGVRRSGPGVWRPGPGTRAGYLLVGLGLLLGSLWLATHGPISTGHRVEYVVVDLAIVLGLPVVLLRWRLVLEQDELVLVFVRARRLDLREIVAARCVAKQGLVFVCADGSEHSFAGLGNSAWGHRRRHPTRADLAARAVLCAAATARGEVPPVDFRLPPLSGRLQAALEGGVVAFLLGLVLGD
jgi:hypothetical protein